MLRAIDSEHGERHSGAAGGHRDLTRGIGHMKRIMLGLVLLVGLGALGACAENPQVPSANGVWFTAGGGG